MSSSYMIDARFSLDVPRLLQTNNEWNKQTGWHNDFVSMNVWQDTLIKSIKQKSVSSFEREREREMYVKLSYISTLANATDYIVGPLELTPFTVFNTPDQYTIHQTKCNVSVLAKKSKIIIAFFCCYKNLATYDDPRFVTCTVKPV